ncbi:serine--tRNA ligase [Kineosporia sp. J2-2]|uniref:Serine--tRNA ligase n=1 Tax=Kineosporia corallincola TaxID=2835133 RepID=A0ABS5T8V5_9ACTN|nr:serine--tRNA ligase [Kineosporia corallincola]MBT0767509.1 serine--tRNA ligase [Kineosporia corallincola]
MHDPRVLLDPGTEAVRRLARRGYTLDVSSLEELLSSRNAGIKAADDLRAESKKAAAEVGRTAKAGGDVTELKERARRLKDQIKEAEEKADQAAADLREWMLSIPNLPLDRIPDGFSDEDATEIRRWGTPPEFGFTPLDHVELGERTGILDFGRATKLSGPRFRVARGAGAALERGLVSFFLDLHTREHGYTEYAVPHLVAPSALVGTGQLPKFEEDLFRTAAGSRDLYLIPTAEVPLTNLHADEIVEPGQLPLAYTARTTCFRSEAGSYGRDTRGLIRLHEFEKVEMVRIVAADQSQNELEKLVGHAESVLQKLGLAHRTILLAAGDTGFGSQSTYDVEVWLPGQNTYREISSCSDCGQFQARRANIRTRTEDGKRELVATLNGSGLPIGRTMAALLENGQQADGSVVLPEALANYTGFGTIHADGKTD